MNFVIWGHADLIGVLGARCILRPNKMEIDSINVIKGTPIGTKMAIPKYIWDYPTGTWLSHDSAGQLVVAKPGDWVIATLVNEGLSRYAVVVSPYKMGVDITYVDEMNCQEYQGPFLKNATLEELLDEIRGRCYES